ncbi:MAG TPA: septum formation initiator family protein [Gaiellaceae bacterium]|nr:septum formation initiator family protein [Gaiellaceae bacterium]
MPHVRRTWLLAAGGAALLVFLYWKPLHSYMRTKREVQERQADVRALRAEQARLQRRIAAVGSSTQLVREARRLGLVKPGERLFIVKGIPAWRRAH